MSRTAVRKESKKMTQPFFARTIQVGLIVLFSLMPLFFLGSTYQGAAFEKQAFLVIVVILGILAWGVRGLLGKGFDYRGAPLLKIVLIFGLLSVLSLIFADDRYHAFFGVFAQPNVGVLTILALIALYFLTAQYCEQKWIERLVCIHVAISAFIATWFLASIYGILPTAAQNILPANTIGSVSSLALYFVLSLPLAISLFQNVIERADDSARGRVVTLLITIGLIVLVYTVFVLFGYISWIILGIGMLLLMVLSMRDGKTPNRKRVIVPALILLLTIVFYFFGENIRLTNAPLPSEASLRVTESWDVAKEALKDHPILGTGIGSYGAQFSQHRPDVLTQAYAPNLRFISPTGAVFGSLSTLGVLGAVVVIGFLVLLFVSLLRTAFAAGTKSTTLSALTVSSAMFILAVLMLRLDGSIVIIGFMLIILCLLSGAQSTPEKMTIVSFPKKYALVGAICSGVIGIILVLLAIVVAKNVIADHALLSSAQAYAAGDTTQLSSASAKALSLNNKQGRYYTILGEIFHAQANREAAKPEGERDVALLEQFIQAAVDAADRATDLMPHDAFAHELRGYIYENSGGFVGANALTEAKTSYERAKEREPGNVTYDVALTRIHLVQLSQIPEGEASAEQARAILEQAKKMLTDAIAKKQNYAPAYDALSQIEELLGNQEQMIYNAVQAVDKAPNNFSYNFRLAQLFQQRGEPNDLAIAERLLVRILGVNDADLNTRLALGLVYERAGEKDLASAEYQKVYDRIEDKESEAAKAVENLIATLKDGGSNIADVPQGQNPETTFTPEENSPEGEERDSAFLTDVAIAILDGGSANGDVGRVTDDLRAAGLTEPIIGEARTSNNQGIIIYYDGEAEEVSSAVADLLEGYGPVQRRQNATIASQRDADIVVVVGALPEQESSSENSEDTAGESSAETEEGEQNIEEN